MEIKKIELNEEMEELMEEEFSKEEKRHNVCCNYELQRGPVSSLIKLYRFRAGLSAAINR